MEDWEPDQYTDDETANAILNVAAAIDRLAKATDGLLYGLKYSKGEGMSIAEAIEVGAKGIAERAGGGSEIATSISRRSLKEIAEVIAEAIRESAGSAEIAEAVDLVGSKIADAIKDASERNDDE